MSIAKNVRRKSLEESKPFFNNGEMIVLRHINMGYRDAWSISKKSGLLITSVRRALTDMHQRGAIVETATKFNEETQRSVTTYAVATNNEVEQGYEAKLF